jgi:hypothetical protein
VSRYPVSQAKSRDLVWPPPGTRSLDFARDTKRASAMAMCLAIHRWVSHVSASTPGSSLGRAGRNRPGFWSLGTHCTRVFRGGYLTDSRHRSCSMDIWSTRCLARSRRRSRARDAQARERGGPAITGSPGCRDRGRERE